jgi:serine/threonine protein kinase
MPSVLACPDAETLQRFLLGQAGDVEAEALERHLENCENCVSTLQTLDGADSSADSVIEALRSGVGITAGFESDAARRLAERLKELRPVAFVTTSSETGTLSPLAPAGDNATEAALGSPHAKNTVHLHDFLAPAESPDELGRLGQYRVRKVLGAGGMGVVFQAFDPHLDRLVALKAMLPSLAPSPSAKQRFLREAKAAAAIKHDHIVTIYQVGEHRGAPFLAMELLEGESLEARLKREGRLPVPEVLRIARETAEALAAAHERGLIHRDIKPDNIWLEGISGQRSASSKNSGPANSERCPVKASRVKILDFGLARPAEDDLHLTQQGSLLGTPAYMAPEQAGGRKVDARSDLFSLGCVLYRMATGELPFKGAHTIAILMTVSTQPPRPPQEVNADLPPAVSALIMRLLAKNPDERLPSARALVEAIQAIEGGTVSDRVVMAPSPVTARRRSFPRLRLAGALAALVGFVAFAAWLFGPTIIRYAANEGQLVIVIDDPKVQAVVERTGVTIHDEAKERHYRIKPGRRDFKTGDYMLEVTEEGGVHLFTREFTIKRGGTTSVKITFDPKTDGVEGKAVSWTDPAKEIFADKARALEHVLDFKDLVGATAAEFDAWLAALGPHFRLSLANARNGAGTTLFNAVAVREKQPRLFRLYKDLTHDDHVRTFQRIDRDSSSSFVGACQYAQGDQLRSLQLYTDDCTTTWACWDGLTEIRANVEEKKANGYRPICLDAARLGDRQCYHSIQVIDKRHKWRAFLNLNGEELLSAVKLYAKDNWRPDVLAAHGDGKQTLFMFVMVENTIAVDWFFRMDMSAKEYRDQSAAQKRRGLFPLALTSYGDGDKVQYAAVWVRYRIPGMTPAPPDPQPLVAHKQAEKVVAFKGKEGSLLTDPAHALGAVTDMRDLAGASPPEFHKWLAALEPEFRLALLNSRVEGDGPVLNAVAVRDSKPLTFKFHPEMNLDEAGRTYRQMEEAHFRELGACDYPKQGQPVRSQLWLLDSRRWYEWINELPFLMDKINSDDGRRPISLDAPASAGDARYYRAIGAESEGHKWKIYYTLSADELLATIVYCRDQGWRPDVLTPHWYEGELRFILVVVDNHEETSWRFRMDMSLPEYRTESAEQKRHGYLPLALVSYKNNTDARYAAVWVPFRIR